ncbi:protein sisterless A-like [Calliphora vicina]|uniref:protein sisterless A-like n=1 Tax=Calliphora vicina TaxID=7373 RepID=UPI00325AD485
MEQSPEAGYFLRQVYSSLTKDFQMQPFNPASMENVRVVKPHNIGYIVGVEMKRIKENCLRKEEQYVEQMLLENPITIERRTSNNNPQPASSDDEMVDVVTVASTSKRDMQQQRADACRRSRYNNKVRKAKTMYRHKFMTQKLMQSTKMYDCIQELIAQTETYLLSNGMDADTLLALRNNYNIDKANETVQNLKRTMNLEK